MVTHLHSTLERLEPATGRYFLQLRHQRSQGAPRELDDKGRTADSAQRCSSLTVVSVTLELRCLSLTRCATGTNDDTNI
ncbi:hypothetical protein EVAR_16495_1 [Eumeta japonica]|uniref:Uncharacterized protein n=1 Tax=Eumeta variegata TaxID=151549 RepID=A0A4C1UKC7_EUMVA|nr:hypothetical protein EVAR_16495_1 [Eumeta japonica]